MFQTGNTVLVISAPDDPDYTRFIGHAGTIAAISGGGDLCVVDFSDGSAAFAPTELASMGWQTALEHNASIISDEDPSKPLVYIDQENGVYSVTIAASGMAPDVLENATAEEVQAKLEAWGINPDAGWR